MATSNESQQESSRNPKAKDGGEETCREEVGGEEVGEEGRQAHGQEAGGE